MKTAAPRPRSGETPDSFYRGRVRIFQKRKGYRFSVDAPLLADFIQPRRTDDILEIGTGSGIIPLLLSIKPFGRITAVEIQRSLANLARRNIALNGLEDRIEVVQGDFRAYVPGRKFDLVFSNPPYIRKATGHLSATAEKAVAKHEIHGDINDLMQKTAEWLKPAGRACFIYPEGRRDDFMEAVRSSGLHMRIMRPIRPRRGAPVNLFLAEIGHSARTAKAAEKTRRLPALVLFGPKGTYTKEAEAIFSGRKVSPARGAAGRKRPARTEKK
jgi:tRNA1Val (adenine37-N6)-methyltransferase